MADEISIEGATEWNPELSPEGKQRLDELRAEHRPAFEKAKAAKALEELAAQEMAESVGLVWNKLPDQSDMVCSHGMPEGCKNYWRELSKLASQIFNKQ